MNRQANRIYRLDGIEIDPARFSLKRDGKEQHVRQKTFQVLIYLLEKDGRLITKDELIEHVWADTAVTDNALDQCLMEIRRVLGDDPRQPRFIRTIPRAGYRFIGKVEEVNVPDQIVSDDQTSLRSKGALAYATSDVSSVEVSLHAKPRRLIGRRSAVFLAALALVTVLVAGVFVVRRRSSASSALNLTLPSEAGKRTVAVMYFDNGSSSADIDWLREGLADMLITDLARSKNLAILSREQLRVLLDRIGHKEADKITLDQALDVANRSQAKVVILGNFARLGDQIRVDVQLYDARNGQMLTAERLVVEKPDQILTQVDLLSLKLASHLGAPGEQETDAGLASVMTNNLQAYRYYSLGVEKANTMLYVEAVALLEKAVALDPEFAMAYARIGYTYALDWQRVDDAKPYLEKAFQLSGRLTEKDKLSITAWYAVANQDYRSAIETYRQIISRYPLEVEAYWRLARLLRGEERMGEAADIAKQGLIVDSEAKDLYNVLGTTYTEMGRHDEAIAMLRRGVELAPEDVNIYDSLGMAYQWAGRYAEATETFEKALSLNPQFEIAVIHLGNTYCWQGRYRDAMRQYQRFIQVASTDASRARGYDGIAMLHLKKKESNEAERAARSAAKYDKHHVGPLLRLALEQHDLVGAEKLMNTYEVIPFIDRGNRGFERERSYYRGYLGLKSGRAAEAVQYLTEAVRHRPMEWYIDGYEDCLADAYLELGRLDEAIAEYERILKLNPNYPLVHYHLAQVYERKGQKDQARAEYERFLQVWKDADTDIPEVVAARKAE